MRPDRTASSSAIATEAAGALNFYLDRNLSPIGAGTELNIYVGEDPRGGGVIYPNSLYWDDELVDNGDTSYGGRWVVNPSGGLISKGHPLGATGLAQCAEMTWQLRGDAERRQVASAATKSGVALAHNIGLGGASFVTAYRPANR